MYCFLSDLCGREGPAAVEFSIDVFLSDLCGREEDEKIKHIKGFFSKRPVRS